MHLWPTMRKRDSFKIAYLKKLEWNLHRMNNEKKQRSQETSDSNQQRLLDDGDDNRTNQHQPAKTYKAVLIFCREILMLVTCCYCCFCCGGKDLIFSPFIVFIVFAFWGLSLDWCLLSVILICGVLVLWFWYEAQLVTSLNSVGTQVWGYVCFFDALHLILKMMIWIILLLDSCTII